MKSSLFGLGLSSDIDADADLDADVDDDASGAFCVMHVTSIID